jgi:hypothetical protein
MGKFQEEIVSLQLIINLIENEIKNVPVSMIWQNPA